MPASPVLRRRRTRSPGSPATPRPRSLRRPSQGNFSLRIVWGGCCYLNTGGRYNPGMDSWTATTTTNAPTGRDLHTAVWTESEMIVWGGTGLSEHALEHRREVLRAIWFAHADAYTSCTNQAQRRGAQGERS